MKKIIISLFLILGWSNMNAQKPLDNKGAWFVFQNPNITITVDNVVEIMENINLYSPRQMYCLSTGEKFTPIAPQLWEKTMKEIISLIEGKQIFSVADSVRKNGVIVPGDDNLSGSTTNYGVTNKGEIFEASTDYKGGENVNFLLYKGYPILKVQKPCMNPNKPNRIVVKKEELPVLPPKEEVVKPELKEVVFRPSQQIQPYEYKISYNYTYYGYDFGVQKPSAWKRWIGPTLKWTGISVGAISVGYGVYKLCEKHGKPAPAPITPKKKEGPGKVPITEVAFSFSF